MRLVAVGTLLNITGGNPMLAFRARGEEKHNAELSKRRSTVACTCDGRCKYLIGDPRGSGINTMVFCHYAGGNKDAPRGRCDDKKVGEAAVS
jgi:hypothetical protein